MDKILVFSPHYDDDVIGCGGSLAIHSERGDEIGVAYVMSGWSGVPSVSNRRMASSIRRREAKKANQLLGVSESFHLGIQDRSFVPNEQMLHLFVKVIRRWSPTVVYVPHNQEGDEEHKLVSRIAKEALWLAGSPYLPDLGQIISPVRLVLGYEVWTPLEHHQFARDITGVIDQKKKALAAHESQISHKRWDMASMGLNAYRGVTTGEGEFVEVFSVVRLRE